MIYNLYNDAVEFNTHASIGALSQINQLRSNMIGNNETNDDQRLAKRPAPLLEPAIDRILNGSHVPKKVKQNLLNTKNNKNILSESQSEIEEPVLSENKSQNPEIISEPIKRAFLEIQFDKMLKVNPDQVQKRKSFHDNEFSDEDSDLFVF